MKLVILGRDGVINVAPATYVDAPENWEPLPGSLEALARLHRHGYRVVIVTHQPAVAHGALHMETLNRIHARMLDLIRHKGGEVEAIFVCPHGPESRCRCRPPLPGLFEELAERLKINLSGVMMVASADEEIAAARAAGAQPVRIAPNGQMANGLPAFDTLQQFSDALLTGRLELR
jgi:D-glycero-D-manno-heptose 1,7-bisphosphate phosphatase